MAQKPLLNMLGVGILVTAVLVAWTVWGVRKPPTQATKAWETIRPGMSLADVEECLRDGRNFCFYQLKRANEWQRVSRNEFVTAEKVPPSVAVDTNAVAQTNVAATEFRLQLTFTGMAPNRTSFIVDMDSSGRVERVTGPHTWE